MTDERHITISDVRRAGFCVRGVKPWFAEKGIDFRDFLANGISADDERIAGDAHVERIVATKRKATS